MAFLQVEHIHAYYGESYIVQDVSFSLEKGQILAILGRNGAGKTSTLRAIARATQPELRSGRITLDSKDLSHCADWQASRAGIQLVPEDRRIIPGLSVEENLKLAQVADPLGWDIERVYRYFPRLAERRTQEGITLSGGEQQMLAVARALVRDVKVLLLDEPYEGLAPTIRQEIEKIMFELKDQGFTTILVEQDAMAALKLADKALILDTGVLVYSGEAKDVLIDKELRERYLAL